MRVDRILFVTFLACTAAGLAHAGTKQTCKRYLAEHVPAIRVLPQVTGLDRFSADPGNAALRASTLATLGYQDTETLQGLASRISAAYDNREDCVGDVGRKVTVEGEAVDPSTFVSYVEALHDHGLPLLSEVVDARLAGVRAEAERARTSDELATLNSTWSATVARLAEARAAGSIDAATVEALRAALPEAATTAGKCYLRAALLRVRPPGDDFADEVRAFAGCLDLPADTTPSAVATWIRDEGFLGAVGGRDASLRDGRPEAAVREWEALLDVFGGEAGGSWSDAADDGVPEDVRRMAAAAPGRGWPARSRIELGLYCLGRDAACVERQLAGDGAGLDVSESALAEVAGDLAASGDPRAVDLWKVLETHGSGAARYRDDRLAHQISSGSRDEVLREIGAMVAAGECARAARVLEGASTDGPVPLADAALLRPCTRNDDAEGVAAAWEVIGDAYRQALSAHMQAEPQRLREAVALAREALAIPDAHRGRSVTDYAKYVLEVSEARSSDTIDTATARRTRMDGCTQTLGSIEWKRRREDPSYRDDLAYFRAYCCDFLRTHRDEWVAWMRSGAETTDAQGRTSRRDFTAQEIENKQAGLGRYCDGG